MSGRLSHGNDPSFAPQARRAGARAHPRMRARAITAPRERGWGPVSSAHGAGGAAPRLDTGLG